MKKVFLLLVLGLSSFTAINAQVEGKAIGLRFGGVAGSGAEVSYLHPLGSAHRLEFDLGFNSYGTALNGVYQWVWDLSTLADGFNWYAGLGASVGIGSSSYVGVGVLGQVGIEYNFKVPIQLSLDYRPSLLLPYKSDFGSTCLSVRYRF